MYVPLKGRTVVDQQSPRKSVRRKIAALIAALRIPNGVSSMVGIISKYSNISFYLSPSSHYESHVNSTGTTPQTCIHLFWSHTATGSHGPFVLCDLVQQIARAV
ncbi:unnamed protein product [Staurois parvus]|uniref:Uncharacterized protein n=1 Tax=Staurois parvus TaxID=386267 RepID=A0ABN9HQF8_9NEOB|nr:unnamed protein product [Staurois parvus]